MATGTYGTIRPADVSPEDVQNNIYQQFNLYEIKDDFNNLLYEVKQNRNENIDFSKSFQNITEQ